MSLLRLYYQDFNRIPGFQSVSVCVICGEEPGHTPTLTYKAHKKRWGTRIQTETCLESHIGLRSSLR